MSESIKGVNMIFFIWYEIKYQVYFFLELLYKKRDRQSPLNAFSIG